MKHTTTKVKHSTTQVKHAKTYVKHENHVNVQHFSSILQLCTSNIRKVKNFFIE